MTRTYAQTRDEIKRLSTPEQRKAKGIKLNASHAVLKQVLALLQAQASEPAQAPDTQAQAQETTIAHDHAPEIAHREELARLQALLAQAEQDRDTYFTQLKQAQAELAQVRDELAQAQAPAHEPAPTPPAPEPAPAPAPAVSQVIIDKITNAVKTQGDGLLNAITFTQAAAALAIDTPATLHAVINKLEEHDIIEVFTCAEPSELDAANKAGISKWGIENISGGTSYYIRLPE